MIKKKYYRKRNNEFYIKLTKEEILNNIDVNNPNTFLPYLKILDYPYIEEVWNMYVKYSKNKYNTFGKYIACMRLKGYVCYGYEDSNFINECLER